MTLVVAGEALIDLVPRGDGALSPLIGGGPFNTAVAAARLGRPTAFVGCVSHDRFGRAIAAALEADGVWLDDRLRTDRPTSLAVAEIDEDGTASYGFHLSGTSIEALTPDIALSAIPQTITALHVGSLALALEPMATSVETLTRHVAGRALVMADPNVRPAVVGEPSACRTRLERIIGSVDVLKVSDADLQHLSPGAPAESAARALLDHGPKLVLLTLGSEGAVAIGAFGVRRVAAPPVQVVDTIGAGDAFSGAWLAHWDEHGFALNDAAAVADATLFACRAASLSCTRAGAAPPCLAELETAGPSA